MTDITTVILYCIIAFIAGGLILVSSPFFIGVSYRKKVAEADSAALRKKRSIL